MTILDELKKIVEAKGGTLTDEVDTIQEAVEALGKVSGGGGSIPKTVNLKSNIVFEDADWDVLESADKSISRPYGFEEYFADSWTFSDALKHLKNGGGIQLGINEKNGGDIFYYNLTNADVTDLYGDDTIYWHMVGYYNGKLHSYSMRISETTFDIEVIA